MSDIFISYAEEDAAQAERLAEALEAKGWLVWWDRSLLAGEDVGAVIGEQLERALCVIVLWSKIAVKSEWVRDEAGIGKERGILVPARLDSARVPLGFGQLRTEDLKDWRGESDHPGFDRLTLAVTGVIAKSEVHKPASTSSNLARYVRVPDGSRLEIGVFADNGALKITGSLTYGGSTARNWTQTDLLNRFTSWTLSSPNSYQAVVNVAFADAKATAHVEARIVRPDGTRHSRPWKSSPLTGSNGGFATATVFVLTQK